MWRVWAFVCVVVIAVAPQPAFAQNLAGARAAAVAAPHSTNDVDSTTVVAPGFLLPVKPPAVRRFAAVASFVVPGSGQYILGNDRFLGYVAVELLAWWKYSKDVADRADREREYKDLARRVARVNFTKTFPDAGWSYYEWMRDEIESGQFSLSASGPVVPETNIGTYNGKRWALAQATQPNYEAALQQYVAEAIKPEFRWSWRDARLQYDIYTRMTDKRNDAARATAQDLLVIGANHFLSMIDAFATLRLQARTDQDGRARIGASFRW
jgi:hypothetical protein